MNKRLIIYIATVCFLVLGTLFAILYGKGYRFLLGQGKLEILGTGLLVAKSQPDGAQIFLNNHLTTATNNTLNLSPGEYDIRIVKPGYFPWQKKIKIEKEVVSKADALLFTTTPKLEGITDNGVSNPTPDPTGTKLAFTVSSQTPRKNGVYILDMTSRPILTLQSASTQIVDDTIDTFSQSSLSWSPDGKQLVATISASLGSVTTYLLNANSFNETPQDVTETLATVDAQYKKQKTDKERAQLFDLKPNLKKVISENFQILDWSFDETKILYVASQSATLPQTITPPLVGTELIQDERNIQKGAIYVYDTKEDKNYKILNSLLKDKALTWFPDSKHLIFVENREINVFEYDGSNKTTIYAGPFIDDYVFSWPDGSRIVILTNLGNSNLTPNLYTIGLK